MDLETENRIAAMLMKEAAELRRQAEKEGVNVYLRQPKPRVRPNSRFLTATVLGVQQANRSVEVNEMWRVRQKELELDNRLKGRPVDHRSNSARYRDGSSPKSTSKRPAVTNDSVNASCSSSKDFYNSSYSRNDEGLRDEELEEFLHSRAKRGRGAVGSRMDETGPYLPCSLDSRVEQSTISDVEKCRVIYGPEKPSSFKPCASSEEETDDDRPKKKRKKDPSRSSKKQHSEKRRSKSKSKDKKKRKEKKSRHNK